MQDGRQAEWRGGGKVNEFKEEGWKTGDGRLMNKEKKNGRHDGEEQNWS